MSGRYKLFYFEYTGLGNAPRYILNHVGVDFENVVVDRLVEWYEKYKSKAPMGTLPILELPDGRKLSQSVPICRYLGEMFGLTIESPFERAVAEQLVAGGYDDLCPYTNGLIREKTKEDKAALFAEMRSQFLDRRLDFYEDFLGKRSTKYMVTDSVCWTDFVLYSNFFMAVKKWLEIPLDGYPSIDKYCTEIESLASVSEWNKRHDLPWTAGPYSIK